MVFYSTDNSSARRKKEDAVWRPLLSNICRLKYKRFLESAATAAQNQQDPEDAVAATAAVVTAAIARISPAAAAAAKQKDQKDYVAPAKTTTRIASATTVRRC